MCLLACACACVCLCVCVGVHARTVPYNHSTSSFHNLSLLQWLTIAVDVAVNALEVSLSHWCPWARARCLLPLCSIQTCRDAPSGGAAAHGLGALCVCVCLADDTWKIRSEEVTEIIFWFQAARNKFIYKSCIYIEWQVEFENLANLIAFNLSSVFSLAKTLKLE